MSLLSTFQDIRNPNDEAVRTGMQMEKQRLMNQDKLMMFLCKTLVRDGIAHHRNIDTPPTHNYRVYTYLENILNSYTEIMEIVHKYDDNLIHVAFRCLCGSVYTVLINTWIGESIDKSGFENRENFISAPCKKLL